MRSDQIKQLASTLSNLGVGIVLAGVVGPAVLGKLDELSQVALWVALGLSAIAIAHELLGRLP
jgi:uncharacterized membrane protein YqgA involved in biofilm formation